MKNNTLHKQPPPVALAAETPLPTTAELAGIIATLAQGKAVAPEKLASEALRIWQASNATLETAKRQRAAQAEAAKPPEIKVPPPKKYPVTFDEFVRLLFPHLSGRTGEQHSFFRSCLAYQVAFTRRYEANRERSKPLEAFMPSKAEVDAMIAERRRHPMDKEKFETAYRVWIGISQNWRRVWTRKARRAAAAKSVEVRESKRRTKQLKKKL